MTYLNIFCYNIKNHFRLLIMLIKTYEFSEAGKQEAGKDAKSKDWPVVYMITKGGSSPQIYVGETASFITRFSQHLSSIDKKHLGKIHVIYDDEFNKSAILDIEQNLIRLFSADGKFNLLNANAGQSASHNYYQREKYVNKIPDSENEIGIWSKLKQIGLANDSYDLLVNSNLFKYSPYTSLTVDQTIVCLDIIDKMIDGLNDKSGKSLSFVVEGGAGTGKTILAIYMMALLVNANKQSIDTIKEEENSYDFDYKGRVLHKLNSYVKEHGELKIGYVLPMTSIRKTIKTVFRRSGNGLKSGMVIGPAGVVGIDYDLLVVDECHRLSKRKNIEWMGEFDKNSIELGLNPLECNTLDWIVKQSKTRILFFDKEQTIKNADITAEEFNKSLSNTTVFNYTLTSQLRCNGGELYINYLSDLFNCSIKEPLEITNYNLKVFDDPNKMIDAIKDKNSSIGLCRVVAGYAWPWKSKNKSLEQIAKENCYDITFGSRHYMWNMSNKEWIIREDSINEIGCVHTTQGYDLNYVGVIFGKEIDYDPIEEKIIVYRQYFFDSGVKKQCDENELRKYIINAYKVMMERGIKGCYVYACNENLRDYLKKYLI